MNGADVFAGTPLEVARCLVSELGFSVIPLDHPDRPVAREPKQVGKVPTIGVWKPFQERHPSGDELVAWFSDRSMNNIGVVTGAVSGVVVVDLDSAQALAWGDAHLPPTPMRVVTAKGQHWYYRHPGSATKNKVRIETADGVIAIDIRGDGGYVVAPGSTHHTGHVYRVLERWPSSVDGLPVFDSGWFGSVEKPSLSVAADDHTPLPLAGIAEGQRNTHLASLAGAMRRHGAEEGVILAALQEANRTKCRPPLEDAEVANVAVSVARYTPATLDFEQRVAAEIARRRASREAARRLDAEEHESPSPVFETLRQRLARSHPATTYRIHGWQPTGSRVILAAQFKAGKTTLIGNLIRSLVDGDAWLDYAPVSPLAGPLMLLDFEMAPMQLDAWLDAQGIQADENVIVESMRGRVSSFDILNPTVRSLWAQCLRARDVKYVVLDCLRPVLDGLGLDENSDAGRFLVAFDALLHESGVAEALIVHHMGHSGERSRGDSRLRDWPDVEWRLVRSEADDPASPRFITAYGRDVDVHESQLAFDSQTRHLTVAGGSRREANASAALDGVLGVIDAAQTPLSGRGIKDALKSSGLPREAIESALRMGVREGVLQAIDGNRNARLYSRAAVSRSVPPVSQSGASECPSAYMHGHSRTSRVDDQVCQDPLSTDGDHQNHGVGHVRV